VTRIGPTIYMYGISQKRMAVWFGACEVPVWDTIQCRPTSSPDPDTTSHHDNPTPTPPGTIRPIIGLLDYIPAKVVLISACNVRERISPAPEWRRSLRPPSTIWLHNSNQHSSSQHSSWHPFWTLRS